MSGAGGGQLGADRVCQLEDVKQAVVAYQADICEVDNQLAKLETEAAAVQADILLCGTGPGGAWGSAYYPGRAGGVSFCRTLESRVGSVFAKLAVAGGTVEAARLSP